MPMNPQLQKKLLNHLPQFGLNPKDWCLQKINCRNYLLKNRHDEDLCLWGEVQEGNAGDWQDLQWLSV